MDVLAVILSQQEEGDEWLVPFLMCGWCDLASSPGRGEKMSAIYGYVFVVGAVVTVCEGIPSRPRWPSWQSAPQFFVSHLVTVLYLSADLYLQSLLHLHSFLPSYCQAVFACYHHI